MPKLFELAQPFTLNLSKLQKKKIYENVADSQFNLCNVSSIIFSCPTKPISAAVSPSKNSLFSLKGTQAKDIGNRTTSCSQT